MTTALVVMNVLAFILSFGAILWVWLKVCQDRRSNNDLLRRLKRIQEEAAREPFGAGEERERKQKEKHDRQRAAGKTMFTDGDMENMPEIVKDLIYRHSLKGMWLQVVLVGLGLALGAAANVIPLLLPLSP